MPTMTETAPYMDLHVPPDEMVKYIQVLMKLPHGEIAASSAMALAQRHWGGDTPLARAALLRWGALNLAFQDKRLETWTVTREHDRIQVPAALVAAAGVAPLVIDNEKAVFDIPALLDATLEFQPPAGQAYLFMTTVARPAPKPRFNVLRTIAVYKMVKVLLLLALAYGEVRLSDASLAAKLVTWASARPLGLEHDVATRFLGWFSGLSTPRLHALRMVTLAYAAVFATEGIGVWMQKRWAEWLTVIITASLIPLEVWELIFRPTIGKAAVVVANTAIVIYLAWHVRSKGKRCSRVTGLRVCAMILLSDDNGRIRRILRNACKYHRLEIS